MQPTITLQPEQREILQQALADAVYYRDPPVYCPACETQDALCDDCTAGAGPRPRLPDAQPHATPSSWRLFLSNWIAPLFGLEVATGSPKSFDVCVL